MIPKTHLVSSKPWEQNQEIGKEEREKKCPVNLTAATSSIDLAHGQWSLNGWVVVFRS